MHDQLRQRLQELKTEYAAGQGMLAELAAKQANLESTLLRISGAIQVLEELLAAGSPASSHGSAPLQPQHAANGAIEGTATLRQVNASHE